MIYESRALGPITVMVGIYVTRTSLDLLSSTVALPNPDRLRPTGKYLSSVVSERKLLRNRYGISIFDSYKNLMKRNRNMILCNMCMFGIKVRNALKSVIPDKKAIPIPDLLNCFLFFVCFITKSFLTYSLFSPTPALSTISRPLSSSMCSITPEIATMSEL